MIIVLMRYGNAEKSVPIRIFKSLMDDIVLKGLKTFQNNNEKKNSLKDRKLDILIAEVPTT